MTLPFKPHLIALVCSAGLFAASGVLYVKSRAPEAPASVLNPLRRNSVRHFARICTPMCLAGTTVDRRHGNRNSYAAWKVVAAVT